MTDKAPALASEDEAREILGADAFEEALANGSVRRVEHSGGLYVLGSDVDRVAREHDPAHLARVVRCEVDEDDDDGPRALAERQRRL